MFNIWQVHMLLTWLLARCSRCSRSLTILRHGVMSHADSNNQPVVVWVENGRWFVVFRWNVSCLNTRFPQNFTTSFELLKEAQHAIVTLHVFCVLSCLKQEKVAVSLWELMVEESTKNHWSSKWKTETDDCAVSYPVFTKNDTKWIQLLLFGLHNKIHPSQKRVCFENPLRLSKSGRWCRINFLWICNGFSRRCRFHPVGWLEALKKLEEQLQILHKVWNDWKSAPRNTKDVTYSPRKLEKQREKIQPCKIDCKMIFSFLTLKFVPFWKGG